MKLRSLLYVNFPNVVRASNVLKDSELFFFDQSSQLDLMVHGLFKTLLDFNRCESSFKLLANISVQYPKLMLRYLPEMTALLSGRSHLAPAIFLERDFYRLFSHCLSLIDLLRPSVFFAPGLEALLECYFSLVTNWSSTKHNSVVGLIEKFVSFLCHFVLVRVDPVMDKRKLFVQLSKTYPDISKLNTLVSLLQNPSKNKANSDSLLKLPMDSKEISKVKHSLLLWKSLRPVENTRGSLLFIPENLTGQVSSSDLDSATGESMKTLEELSVASKQIPILLQYFLGELLELIQCSFAPLRHMSYELLISYLNIFPQAAEKIIPQYLTCFRHSSLSVQADALQHAEALFYFAQDYATSFLSQLFEVGMPASPVLKNILHNITLL